MKTYRVKMNDTNPTDNHKPLGIYYRHLESNSLTRAKRDAEKSFYGQCEAVVEKRLTSKQLLVNDMRSKRIPTLPTIHLFLEKKEVLFILRYVVVNFQRMD